MNQNAGKYNYYAVRNGRESGVIVETWKECRALVWRYPKAEYKAFQTYEEAVAYLADSPHLNTKR